MGFWDFFRRKKARATASKSQDTADEARTPVSDSQRAPKQALQANASPREATKHGPWDISQEALVPDQAYLDLGALKIPERPDTAIRLGISQDKTRILAVTLTHNGSSLQLTLLAASRDHPLWDEVRASIDKGKSPKQVKTRFGTGIAVDLGLPDGTIVPTRIMGIDGPRWMLRAIVTGDAAKGGKDGTFFDDLLADVVVDRGEIPAAPKEIIPLTAPGSKNGDDADKGSSTGSDDSSHPQDKKSGKQIPDSRPKGPLTKGMNSQAQQILTRKTMFSEVR